MESLDHFISEFFYYKGEVVKRVVANGSGPAVAENSKILLSEKVFSDSSKSLVFSSDSKEYKLIQYPESATISPYDSILLTLQEGDEVWVKFPYTIHNVKEACWDTIWYHIKVLNVDSTPDLLSLPQFLPFLREHVIGPEKKVKKRVLSEGTGFCALVNSRITYCLELMLDNGCEIEIANAKSYTLTRGIGPAAHSGVHLALYTMRIGEKALIYLPPGFHVVEKFKNNGVWARVLIESIEFSNDLVYPQLQPFIEENILKSDGGVIKRILKYGEGPVMEGMSKVWVDITGRLEDGYLFQKPKEEVITLIGGKIYSEGVILGLGSMKRGETSWIRSSPETHLYKEGYEKEALWFLLTIKEYIEPYEKIVPQMPIEYKLELADQLLVIAKRLYSSGTKRECRTIYNDIITALKLKKDGFGELPTETKPKYIDVRGRAMMNAALLLLKDAENSDKEDFKIKTVQKIQEFCLELLKYDPNNVKAFYRKAQSHFLKKEYQQALEDLKKILENDPKNKDALSFIKKIKAETQKTDKQEKKVYQGIFNGSKWLEEGCKEEAENKKRMEEEEKAQIKWKEEVEKRNESIKKQQIEYEEALNRLEKGVIVDTTDATDPITDMFLLDD